ncbi:MAG TPA: hypothetical protein VMZ28_01935 [Kofleriaceae bacterium]|nr:hypothetical protein [Kofleriaceae bacterium]
MIACPKCDRDVPAGADACAGCGLAVARFDGYADQDDSAPSPEVAAAWARCAAEWEDPESHERFLRVAAAAGSFAFAGRAYRRAARERGPDDRRAADGADRVRRLAEAAYLSRPLAGAHPAATVDRERFRKHATLVLVFLLVLALGGMVVYLLRASARERARTQNSRVFLIESTE